MIDQSAKAPRGILRGTEEEDEYGETQVILSGNLSRKVAVSFPDVVEYDLLEQITALIDASTLKGQSLAGTLDLKTITRLLLRVPKVDDADDLLMKLFPTDDLIMQRARGNSPDPKADPVAESRWESLDHEIVATLTEIQGSLNESD